MTGRTIPAVVSLLRTGLLLLAAAPVSAQTGATDTTLRFDSPGWGGGPPGTIFFFDSSVVHSGRVAARLERDANSTGQFTVITRHVPIDFGGRSIELRAFLRTKDVQGGGAGLWMREDGANGPVQFDNMRDRRVTGTSDWAEYTIQLPLDASANDLYFGVLLGDPGKVWADGVQLLVDGKPFGEAPKRERDHTQRDSATAWIASNAIRLTTVEPGHGFADMEPLRDVIGDARVVALGEATHGTREFFQLKHRMLEFLVSEMDFTAFGIEATMPEALDIDDYVQTGRGDPGKALAGLYFWTWNTEEVLALIEWMRRWNADPQHVRKVHFYGFDMQSPSRAARVVQDYLRQVDPETLSEEEHWLGVLADPFRAQDVRALPAGDRDSLAAAAGGLLTHFDQRRTAWTARSSDQSWTMARQHARVLAQNLAAAVATDSSFVVRDRSMAENALWILDREGPQGRIVLWAHNGHVANRCEGIVMMGCHLRRALADSLVIAGFAFNRGGFQAMEMPFSSGRGLRSFTVGPLDENSLDATLARAGLSVAALDLRTRPSVGPVAEWFAQPLQTRSIGAGFSEASAAVFSQRLVVPQLYDVLLFVDSTSAAQGRGSGRRSATTPLPSAVNLGFEEVGGEGRPEGWNVSDAQSEFDFTVGTSTDDAAEGRYAAVVSRTPGRHYGETSGGLSQRIDATQFRGKRVRLEAMVRTNLTGEASQAYLWLQAVRPDEFMFTPDGSVRHSSATQSRTWAPVVVEADIPSDAVSVSFGLALVGGGEASIDAVRLEIVP